MSATTTPKAEHRPLSNADYHAHTAIGSGMLEDFRRSRRYYHGRYVARTIPPPAPSDGQIVGTLAHMLLLEPGRFDETVCTLPATAPDGSKWNWRKPSHRESRDEFIEAATSDGKLIVTDEIMEQVRSMVESVGQHEYAQQLLEGDGQAEFSIFWTDELTGLELKCRVDWFADVPVDVKTTIDPSPAAFAKNAVGYGYHRQRAHYSAGIEVFTGERQDFAHIAIGNTPPYVVCVYDLDDSDPQNGQSLGQYQWRSTLRALQRCYETGDWREPYEKTVVSMRLPSWAFGQGAYELPE